MRKGISTTEFWLGLAAVVFAGIQTQLWPDSPFPTAAFTTLGIWIVARIGQKSLGPVDASGERAWQTSEFWVALIVGAIRFAFPDLPDSVLNMAHLWIFGRPLVKVAKDFQLSDLLKPKQ